MQNTGCAPKVREHGCGISAGKISSKRPCIHHTPGHGRSREIPTSALLAYSLATNPPSLHKISVSAKNFSANRANPLRSFETCERKTQNLQKTQKILPHGPAALAFRGAGNPHHGRAACQTGEIFGARDRKRFSRARIGRRLAAQRYGVVSRRPDPLSGHAVASGFHRRLQLRQRHGNPAIWFSRRNFASM